MIGAMIKRALKNDDNGRFHIIGIIEKDKINGRPLCDLNKVLPIVIVSDKIFNELKEERVCKQCQGVLQAKALEIRRKQ